MPHYPERTESLKKLLRIIGQILLAAIVLCVAINLYVIALASRYIVTQEDAPRAQYILCLLYTSYERVGTGLRSCQAHMARMSVVQGIIFTNYACGVHNSTFFPFHIFVTFIIIEWKPKEKA